MFHFKKELDILRADLSQTHRVAHLILENIEDGIFLIDQTGKILIFNQGAQRITGYQAAQALDQTWLEVLKFVDKHGLNLEADASPIQKTFKQQNPLRQHDTFILSAQNNRIPVHIILTPLVKSNHDIEAVLGVMRDMSLERQMEEAKTDFVSTASHEMRTPLATLEGYLSLILDQELDSQTQTYAQKAHQTVLQLGKLFKDLLTTSESEDGQLRHHPRPLQLQNLIARIVKQHQTLAQTKAIDLEFTRPNNQQEAFLLTADPQRITELLANLLDNALKYTQPRGSIRVSLQSIDRYLQIQIQDNGLGIADKDLPHIFQKFYRVDNHQPGSGLGLFICKKIVELYRGDIWLESQPGQGTTFYINLPKN